MRPAPPVVFDLDGVLLESEPRWTSVETKLFARYGRPYGEKEKLALIGTGLGQTGTQFEAMLEQPGRAADLLTELIELAAEEFRAGVQPMVGAIDLVQELKGSGRPMAVASNSYRRLVDLAIQGSALRGKIDVVVAADEVANPKPAPDLFLEACRRLDVAPSDAVGIEDTPTGIASARAAGLYVIGIPSIEGLDLGDADLVSTSLETPEVRKALGLP